MRRAALLGVLVGLGAGCFSAWEVGGPWSCTEDGKCPNNLTCDDGVCCQPGPNGSPSCPTLPNDNGCPLGSTPAFFYRDLDGDGAGDPNDSRSFCRRPVKERWVVNAGDCNDNDVGIGPNAPERCNAIDDDCNGELDDGPGLPRITWKRDLDGDGFGDDCPTCTVLSCEKPTGFVSRGGDCAPDDAGAYPGAQEFCNGLDENCNGLPDDPPFEGLENPGFGGNPVNCDAGQPGVCQGGGLQCVFTAATGGYAPMCVPRQTPTRDVCGNATDDDCNGSIDGRPGCGGPANLLTEPGVTIGALAFATVPSPLRTTCMKGSAGGIGQGWLNPVWLGSEVRLHVWWAEAAPGQGWDLSTSTTANFPIQTAPINSWDAGTWDTDPATGFPNAVVVLCGPRGAVRYVPSGAARLSTGFDPRVRVPLRGGAGWTLTGNPVDVLPEVTSVELWMVPMVPASGGTSVSFSNVMLTDAGTPGFE